MGKKYYRVYHRQSMKKIKGNLDRSGLIYFLYETWYKDINNVCPSDYNPEFGSLNKDIDLNRLIEAVNDEGILLIKEGKIIEG